MAHLVGEDAADFVFGEIVEDDIVENDIVTADVGVRRFRFHDADFVALDIVRVEDGDHKSPAFLQGGIIIRPFLLGVDVRLLSCGTGSEEGNAEDDDDGEIKAAVNSCSHGENSF